MSTGTDDGSGAAVSDGPDESGAAERWRADRRASAAEHHERLAARQKAESDRARALLAEFVARAHDEGPAPVPLRARSFDRRHTYRTHLTGWYLRQDQTVAVDSDGAFYVLLVPASLGALARGARPEPSDPPLVLGAGGKDGESIDLVDAIAKVLAQGSRPGR